MTGHIVKSFDEELKQLEDGVSEMGERAVAQFDQAMVGLMGFDRPALEGVLDLDTDINRLEFDLDNQVVRILALRQPMAEDLRLIVASLRVARDLERIGDYAKNIAKHGTSALSGPAWDEKAKAVLDEIGQAVKAMVADAVKAFVERDAALAADVRARDREVDRLHAALFGKVMENIELDNPMEFQTHVHYLFVARSLERIGDHATDIAEDALFLIEGKLVSDERPKGDDAATIPVGGP